MATITITQDQHLLDLVNLVTAVAEDTVASIGRLEATLHDPIAQGDLQELVTEAAVTLIEYKGLSRESFVAVEQCRTEIQAKKKEVDERHLQLQNLLYEKDHLQRTMQALRDYPMKELTRMEKEEGVSLLSELGHGLIPVQDHRNNMDILRLEKEEREKMHRDHLEAQSRRTVLAAEIAKLKEALGNEFPRQIEDLTTMCKAIKSKVPDIAMAAPFGGIPQDDLRALPQPLYIITGRLLSYAKACDPHKKYIKVSILPTADVAKPPVSSMDDRGASRVQVDTKKDDDEIDEGGQQRSIVVHYRALQLELIDDDANGRVDTILFYLSANREEVLVAAPGRRGALINLLPADTGESNSEIEAVPEKLFSSAAIMRKSLLEDVEVPRAYLWAQWLGGISPFPPQFMELGLSYSSACIIDRLRARLRAHKVLEDFIQTLGQEATAVPLDEMVASQVFPTLGASTEKSWELAGFTEVPRTPALDSLFVESSCGIENEISGAFVGEQQQQGQDAEQMEEDGGLKAVGGAASSSSPSASWERCGARYFEVTLKKCNEGGGKKEKPLVVNVLVEITPEYPIRPPVFKLNPTYHSKRTFQNAYANVLAEVNAHFDDVIGTHATARDWLLPHQIKKLQFCLNSMDLGTSTTSSHTQARLRWGKDRRRAYSLDVYARLLVPR